MKTHKEVIRYWSMRGWSHVLVIRRGRKWNVVRELCKRRNKKGEMVYRRRRVRIADCAEALWGIQ